MTEWSEAVAFGELRSLVSGVASEGSFARICEVIDEAEAAAPGLYSERWRGYLSSHLERWPASACSVMLPRETRELDELEYGHDVWTRVRNLCMQDAGGPWGELVRGATLRSADLTDAEGSSWCAHELRELFPSLEHLGFSYMYLRKKELDRACGGGVFEGLSSLTISEADLRLPTVDMLMSHLEEVGTLRQLRLESCYLGPRQVERLCASSLVPQLEVFGLSGNGSLKNEGFAHLVDAAPRFGSLRELRLDAVNVSAKSVVALAAADWAPSLERISFMRSGMRGSGLRGFVEAGRLSLLMDEVVGVTTLDLASQELKNRGVAALARCESLSDVESLSLFDNEISNLEPLARSPYIEGVKHWMLGQNELDASQSGYALEIVRRSSPRSLFLNGLSLGDGFLAELFAMEEAQGLESLSIMCRGGYGEEGLEALLGWPGLPGLVALGGAFRVERETELVARALATGFFKTTHDNRHSGQVSVIARPEVFGG